MSAALRQTSCKHCGADIEGSGRDWRDRGNNPTCAEFCGYDEDGVAVYKPPRRHNAVPVHGPRDYPTRWKIAPDSTGRRTLRQPR